MKKHSTSNIFKICIYICLLFNCVNTLADLKEYVVALKKYQQASNSFKKAYKDSFNKTQQVKIVQQQTAKELKLAIEELQKFISGYKMPEIKCDKYDYICNSTFYFTKVKEYIKVIENQHNASDQNIKKAYARYDIAVQKSTKHFLKAIKEKKTADQKLDNAIKKMEAAQKEYTNTRVSCGWLLSCNTQHGIAKEVNRFMTILTSVTGNSSDKSSDKPSNPKTNNNSSPKKPSAKKN